jgi:hypothetical protein
MRVHIAEIPGFPGYRVTSDGRIQSRWRRGTDVWSETWRDLKPSPDGKGYLGLTLCNSSGPHKFRVHQLVATAFVPNPADLPCVRHLDGNNSFNDFSNLAWGTHKDNEDDKRQHGTWGLRMGGAKLTTSQVFEIRLRCSAGEKQRAIAAEYGVSRPTITRITNGTIWRNQ